VLAEGWIFGFSSGSNQSGLLTAARKLSGTRVLGNASPGPEGVLQATDEVVAALRHTASL